MAERIISAISVDYTDEDEKLQSAAQGERVDLSADEEARLTEAKALVPEGFDSFAQYSNMLQDAYRAGRGDVEAAGRLAEARSGQIVDLSNDPGSVGAYTAWLQNDGPTVDEVVAAAEGDPAKARTILEAEENVTGGEPRAGVVAGLNKIIGG